MMNVPSAKLARKELGGCSDDLVPGELAELAMATRFEV